MRINRLKREPVVRLSFLTACITHDPSFGSNRHRGSGAGNKNARSEQTPKYVSCAVFRRQIIVNNGAVHNRSPTRSIRSAIRSADRCEKHPPSKSNGVNKWIKRIILLYGCNTLRVQKIFPAKKPTSGGTSSATQFPQLPLTPPLHRPPGRTAPPAPLETGLLENPAPV